jgi:DNA invertase Pin-like site-specific DNA recombinase
VRAYIDQQGWELVALFREEGISGKKTKRPELDQLLAALDEIDVIVIPKLDRLGRSNRHLLELYERFENADVRLVSLAENIDTSTTTGKLLRGILSSMAEFEAGNIGERVASVTEARARSGKTPGGRFTIYGYRRVNKTLVPNEPEAAIVREMFQQAAAGRSAKEIAQSLNGRGIKPTDATKAWWPSTISRTLRHPAYIGKVRLKGTIYDGEHEPIVPVDLWERVAAMRSGKVTAARKGRTSAGRHLFVRGALRCGICGNAMGARIYRPSGLEVYACNGRDAHGRASCALTPIPREPIDTAVLAYFNDVALDIEASKKHFANAIEAQRTDAATLRLEAERAERQTAEALERLSRDYSSGEISGKTFEQLRPQWNAEHVAAAAQADQMRRSEAALEDGTLTRDAEHAVLERLSALRAAIAGEVADAPDLAAVRAILAKLFERFVIGRFDPDAEPAAHGTDAEIMADIAADPDILRAGEYVIVPFERPEAVAGLGAEYRPILRREPMPFVEPKA